MQEHLIGAIKHCGGLKVANDLISQIANLYAAFKDLSHAAKESWASKVPQLVRCST